METLPLTEVFVPYGHPTVTYVERPVLQTSVDKALALPGAELLVVGPSHTGKTTLVKNRLKHARIENIIEIVLDSESTLELLYQEIATKLVASPGPIEATPWANQRVLLKAKIFEWAAKRPMPIFVDNARKSHVPMLADLVKTFNQWSQTIRDPKLTLIVAGISVDVQDFIRQRPDEVPRFIAVPVNRFTLGELNALIEAGEKALNVSFNADLKDSIVKFSAGLPAVCHHICYNSCQIAGILQTQHEHKVVDNAHFSDAVVQYAEIMMPLYEGPLKAAHQFTSSNGIPARDVLSSLFDIQANADDKNGLIPVTVGAVVEHMKTIYPALKAAEVKEVVDHLASPEGHELLAWRDDLRFTFREPLIRHLYRRRRENQAPIDQTSIHDISRAIIQALQH